MLDATHHEVGRDTPHRRDQGWRAAPLALLAAAALTAGCGSSTSSTTSSSSAAASTASSASSGASSTPPAYCASLTRLKGSIDTLAHTPVSTGGLAALKTNATAAVTDAEAFGRDLRATLSAEAATITQSAASLKTAIAHLGQSPSAANLAAIPPAVATLSGSVKSASKAVSTRCA